MYLVPPPALMKGVFPSDCDRQLVSNPAVLPADLRGARRNPAAAEVTLRNEEFAPAR
jgi:hypothetical protein